jgi:formate dehydrogenase subunit gamma
MVQLAIWDASAISRITSDHLDQEGPLLPALHSIQAEFGHIPADCVGQIAEIFNLSVAEVHGVISFYPFFRSSPPGRYIIQICRAESCQSMGSRALERHAKAVLGVDYHQTSADGEFTLEPVYCLGNCACSPSVRVGENIFSYVDSARFDCLIDELQTNILELK